MAGKVGSPALRRQTAHGRQNRLTRIFHSWFEANERRERRSAGFQPAVSPTSSRQPIRTRRGSAGGQRVGNPRYSRLEVCATAPAGLNYEIFGLKVGLQTIFPR